MTIGVALGAITNRIIERIMLASRLQPNPGRPDETTATALRSGGDRCAQCA